MVVGVWVGGDEPAYLWGDGLLTGGLGFPEKVANDRIVRGRDGMPARLLDGRVAVRVFLCGSDNVPALRDAACQRLRPCLRLSLSNFERHGFEVVG